MINIEYRDDPSGYSGFQIEIHADIQHGKFDAKNTDIQLLNIEEFVSELDKFVLDRTRMPRLAGTYDTYFDFSASMGAVILKYQLGDAFCGRKTSYFIQSGEFEVDQGTLLQFLDGFKELMKAKQGAARCAKGDTPLSFDANVSGPE